MMIKEIKLFGFRARFIHDVGTLSGTVDKVLIGRGKWIGAGYKTGATLFVARNCVTRANMYTRVPLQFGFTRNGNAVPFTSN